MWISRAYRDPQFADSLTDPDRLLGDADCHVIKDEKKMKVGHLTVNIGGTPRSLYIKRYNAFSPHYALISSVVQSGALRSLRGAIVLDKAGIPTVTPVAAVENRRCGIVYKSFFISEEIMDLARDLGHLRFLGEAGLQELFLQRIELGHRVLCSCRDSGPS